MNYESNTPDGAQERLAQLSSIVRVRRGNSMRSWIIKGVMAYSVLFTAWSCDTQTNPAGELEERYDNILLISTDTTAYDADSVSSDPLIAIHGTIRNPTVDTFYSRLGDGFGGGIDQDQLYIAEYTDGRFQKQTGSGNWSDVQRGMLIEGTRTIRILPASTYSLWATAWRDTILPGTFRLRIEYYRDSARSSGDTLVDLSTTFTIQ